jgi:DNA-binding response OmpR family regulator
MPFVILSVGCDPTLLKRRNSALENAGYSVVGAGNSTQAMNKFFSAHFDLVLLCHSLGSERRRLAGVINLYSRSTPVILISDREGETYDYGTAIVGCLPEEIIGGIGDVLSRATPPRIAA